MKRLLLALCLIAIATARSWADPAATTIAATAPAPADRSTVYLEGGVLGGSNYGVIVYGGALAVGYRLGHSPLWLRATGAQGGTDGGLFTVGHGQFTRLGLASRRGPVRPSTRAA